MIMEMNDPIIKDNVISSVTVETSEMAVSFGPSVMHGMNVREESELLLSS
jgi:hypothetical protein